MEILRLARLALLALTALLPHPLPALAASTGTPASPRPLLLYVDPSSERLHILPSLEERGCECVLLHSAGAAAAILKERGGADCDAEVRARVLERMVPPPGEEAGWAEDSLGLSDGTLQLMGVLCGSDGGLADAERLQDALLPERSNGIDPARRDKYLMNEAVRSAGLRAPLQCSASSWAEARGWLRANLGSCYPVVVKPRRGQASVLVGLARDEAQAERMDSVLRDPGVSVSIAAPELGAGESNVVVQEFVAGDEYVVDTVSRDGEHKVLAMWKYDKGEANGAPFVYFGIDAIGVEGDVELELIAYTRRLLDALGWRWGPCHIEVKMAPPSRGADGGGVGGDDGGDGPTPVLIEINAGRWNGEEFQPLAEACNGHDALRATLDAYLDADAWREVPAQPPRELRQRGKNVKLVCSVEGALTASPSEAHAEAFRAMPSLVRFALEANEVGETVVRTVDLDTCAGYCHLVHADAAVVEQDYRALRELQPRLFQVDSAGGVGAGEEQGSAH